MLPGFLGQLQSDFEAICAADFSESAVFTDSTGATLTIPCIFDEAVQHFDPEVQSHVSYPGSRVTVAETVAIAAGFNLRRAGLLVTVRGGNYKIHAKDWEFDGLGQLVIYLDTVGPLGS